MGPRAVEWLGLSGMPHLLVARVGPAQESPRDPPDPRETGLEIRIGEEATWPSAWTYRIPAGDPGWRGPVERPRWTDPNGAYNLRVAYNRRRGRILIRSGSAFGSFLEGTPVRVRVTMGEDAGRDTIPWPRARD